MKLELVGQNLSGSGTLAETKPVFGSLSVVNNGLGNGTFAGATVPTGSRLTIVVPGDLDAYHEKAILAGIAYSGTFAVWYWREV